MALRTSPQEPGNRVSQRTVQPGFIQVASVIADANALTNTTSSWEHCKALFTQIPADWRKISMSFYGYGDGDGGGSPVDATFAWKLYLCDIYGGAQLIGNGTGVIGSQQMTHNPSTGAPLNSGAVDANYCWADTLAQANIRAERDIQYTDYEAQDSISALHVDRYAAIGVWVAITAMTAQGVTSITAVINGFNTP